ncbi:two-component system histidine kinase PnpS [Evansella cellulosilytica]|uniref:histidine kinase n=1 Tax=Evansella cellulosilytica (strain ATCC 21833 / DSM 2522 / FERM P-1141 / JCM 9156 / N-4) TaxID=649639 RepID=E6U0L2_EVAC2|nr:ATP-binding protein [Evansella cellulosilytica]ADU31457.1 multi-sensor signal transduction histidine kinase [Evansella cellulosilytica DSM 2522]
MNSFRAKLIFPITLIILIVLTSLGVILGPLFKEFYFERMSERIAKETEVVALYIEDVPLSDQKLLGQKMNAMADRLEIRITMIDMDGNVIGETHGEAELMENHLSRPEIQRVNELGAGQEVRFSNTVNKELLYYAIPFIQSGEQTAYIRTGIPIEQLNSMYQNIWGVIFVSFLIGFVVIVVLITKITNQQLTPIEDARIVANQLAKGNFSVRTYEGIPNEAGQLNRSLNVLAENLSHITKTYEVQQDRLETLIDNMGSGLLLINSKGDITLVNKTCQSIFQENTDHWINKLYYQVIKHREVIKFIQEILLTEKRIKKHLALPIGIEIRHFDVYGAPIIGSDLSLTGIVLVFHDITELKKLEQARKDFVANVSHELKTPVTSLKGFTETLLSGAVHDEQLREKFLTIISNESERLESLIHDLLELSKIEGSQFVLNWDLVNIDVLLSDVFMMLESKAQNKNIHFSKEVIGDTVIEADAHRIKQVFINIINNAIMYTPNDGEVHVKVIEKAETVIVEVQDTGIGISKKEIPRIFERFYRVDRARSRNSGGTGLGLAIVKHLIEAHRATMSVDSEVGQGTTFKMEFKKQQEKKFH